MLLQKNQDGTQQDVQKTESREEKEQGIQGREK